MLTAEYVSRQSFGRLLLGRPTDRLLLLASLLGIALSWTLVRSHVAAGAPLAEIYHGQRLLASYLLPQKGQPAVHFMAEGDIGRSEIILDEDGARIASSPCLSQRCVLSGPHRHAGDLIACVPNHILVSIRGSDDHRFDAVVE